MVIIDDIDREHGRQLERIGADVEIVLGCEEIETLEKNYGGLYRVN